MLQKKRGFTLVELLVVIAISAIVLTMVGTSMVFVANTSGKLIQEAEDIDMAKNIEKYLRSFVKDDKTLKNPLDITYVGKAIAENESFKIDANANIFDKDSSKIIFSDTGLTDFVIKVKNVDEIEGDDFVVCYMKFDSGKEFEFILGVLQNDTNDENNENSGEVQE